MFKKKNRGDMFKKTEVTCSKKKQGDMFKKKKKTR